MAWSISISKVIAVLLVSLGFITIHAQINDSSSKVGKSDKEKVEADNTAVNKRDLEQNKLTAEHQAKASREDDEITRRIREELVKNDKLSLYGQNVKIITLGGVVTLRGPVKSQQERDLIVSSAHKVSGVRNIQNELEISK